jgi:tripartite-type tricarboxylate transporter receptor subunit TctC
MRRRIFLTLLVLLAVGSAFAQAKYPTKQINIVVGASAGGTSDTVTRFLAKDIEAQLGVPVVVTDKPGGSCSVAFEYYGGAEARWLSPHVHAGRGAPWSRQWASPSLSLNR